MPVVVSDTKIDSIFGNDVNISLFNDSATIQTILKQIENEIQTADKAFIICNLSAITYQILRWKSLLPRVKPFYAVKCNPDKQILSLLATMGVGFDCASRSEISLVLRCLEKKEEVVGKSLDVASHVVFANTFKFKKDMIYASRHGVKRTTFDSEAELERIYKEWPDAELILRVDPPRTYDAVCQLGEKFGAKSEDILNLLVKVENYGMKFAGISFHVGSGCGDSSAWAETIAYCSQVFDVARSLRLRPWLLDIGGGYPGFSSLTSISQDECEKQDTFKVACQAINIALDEFFPQESGVTIIAEPGRYFAMGAMTLATQVIGRAPQIFSHDENENESSNGDNKVVAQGFKYILNDGVYGCFNNIVYDHSHPEAFKFFSSREGRYLPDNAKQYVSRVYGPTCDNFDCISQRTSFPELSVNDWVIWPDMGAYTTAACTDFNGIMRPNIRYLLSPDDLGLLTDILEEEKSGTAIGLSADSPK